MRRTSLRLRFLLCYLITVHFAYAVDLDYFFGSLRSEKSCSNGTGKVACQFKCGKVSGICIKNECYCMTLSRMKDIGSKGLIHLMSAILNRNPHDKRFNDFHDYKELPVQFERRNADTNQETPEYLDESLLHDKPVLRHHIAHFCPNLDVARTCIRKCMEEGKPAFCGKDHVCYCGHKYSNNDKNPVADVSSVYAQFKDLYTKYFGPNYKMDLEI